MCHDIDLVLYHIEIMLEQFTAEGYPEHHGYLMELGKIAFILRQQTEKFREMV
jgi:hypothetical protein